MSQSVNSARVARSLSSLRGAPSRAWDELGCADTVREILQQPQTWRDSAVLLAGPEVCRALAGAMQPKPDSIVLTGSGSSLYVGECLAPLLQAGLGIPCRAIAAGTLLTDRAGLLAPGQVLLISIARSGDSPESIGVVDDVLANAPHCQHLAITCNAAGGLATRYVDHPQMHVVQLPPATNDRSLVMTSSFTNLLLAGSALLPDFDAGAIEPVAAMATQVFERYDDALAERVSRHMESAVYLGSGSALGAAHEAALKMLEMSAGQVRVLPESFLGLRHGPMAWLNRPALLAAFLSGDDAVRGYETDLLRELTRKGLAPERIVVGEGIEAEWVGKQGLAIDLPGLHALPPIQQAMIHVLVGQLLALFHCLHLGLSPDAPSQGILTRVVEPFTLHRAGQGW